MNREWDTPPDGDFARYVERLTAGGAGAPGSIGRIGSREGAARAQAKAMATRKTPAPSGPPSTRAAAPAGPPDLATIFRQLFGQLSEEIRKSSQRR